MATEDLVDQETNGGGAGDAVRTALEHKALLVPAVVGVAGAFAAVKGPSAIRGLSGSVENKVESTVQAAGARAAEGAKENISSGGGLAGKVVGSLTGSGGAGKGGSGGKKTRRLPIQRWTDVAVPVEQAYEAWTKFEQFPKFMHRVLSVERKGKDKLSWEEKIWFSKRQWEGRITEERKNDRIVWKTTSGMSHKGIVSFHKLDDRLTRVMVEMVFEPSGLFEKMGSGLRFVKRAVQADLARFKAYVEMQDASGIDYSSGDQQQNAQQTQDDEPNQDDEAEPDEAQTQEASDEREARRTRRQSTRQGDSSATTSSGTRSESSSRKRSTAKRSTGKRSTAKRSTAKRGSATRKRSSSARSGNTRNDNS